MIALEHVVKRFGANTVLKEITLSYTFYEQPLPEEQAALAVPAGEAVN